jgi:MFS family permease
VPEPRSILSRELLPASIAVFASAVLASFQALGIAAALPDIATDLGNVALLPWVITAFLLTSSLATVLAGPFVDALGVARMFRVAVTAFTLAGFATAFAPSMEALVGLRLVQGVGSGLILATGTTAISVTYPQHLVGRAFAANATVWGVMGVAGPAVAAFILTFLSWEWIFYLNLPLGGLALIAGWKVFPEALGETTGRFDPKGAGLLTVTTIATLFAVDSLDLVSILWIALAVAGLGLYGGYARRAPAPVVRLEHIAPQPYRGLGLSTALLLTGTFAMSTYIPLYVRAGLERSAGITAWSVLPLTVGWTVGAISSSRMADKHSESWIVLLGFLVNIPSLALAWLVTGQTQSLVVAFLLFFTAGIGVGMSTNAALTLLRAVTTSAQMGRVISAHLFTRNQGFTFGSAIGGAVLLLVVGLQLGDVELVRELIAAPEGGGPAGAAAAVRSGFAVTIAVGLGFSIVGGMAAISMRRFLTDARVARRGQT